MPMDLLVLLSEWVGDCEKCTCFESREQQVSDASLRYNIVVLTVCCKQCNGGTLSTSTTSTTNTMNVIFRVIGVIVVQDMSDVLDIFSRVSKSSNTNSKQIEPNNGRVNL